ncbi:MAG: LLM class F420-dependent oxidoreductase [Dehalococcoidia bacterium]
MKCSLMLHTDRVDLGQEFVSAEGVMAISRAAEAAGFDAVAVTDHPFPEDEWMRSGGHHALDPFVPLSFAAAATTRLRLLTYIYVLPYRNPFLIAKSVASLDALSGGRLIFGIAAGYLEPEFEALGIDFGQRNDLTDEALRTMKVAWSQEAIHLEGNGFAARGHTALPRPVQQPHPPIWVGGNSKRAIRRAVELADGWIPIPNPKSAVGRRHTPAIESLDDLRHRIAYAREAAQAAGRTRPLEIATVAIGAERFGTAQFSADQFTQYAAELHDAGVTYLNVGLPGESRGQFADNIAGFGQEMLPLIDRL